MISNESEILTSDLTAPASVVRSHPSYHSTLLSGEGVHI